MESNVSIIHSDSGRLVGVLIMSDDVSVIKSANALIEAFKAVRGGVNIERIVDRANIRSSS